MTNAEYQAGILVLQDAQPNHPLLDDIKRGYGLVNCSYLSTALKSLPTPKDDEIIADDDPEMIKLTKDLSRQYDGRAKNSNRHHTVATQREHAIIVDDGDVIQLKIKETMQKIAYLQKNGKPAEVIAQKSGYEIPSDSLKRYMLKRSLSNSRSYAKRKLKVAASKDPNSDRSKELSKRISDLNGYIEAIDKISG